MNLFKAELKRSLFSIYFIFAAIFLLVILFASILDEYTFGDMTGALHLLDLSRSGPASLLVPIIATIPFAGSFSIERNDGFLPFIFIRIKRQTYILIKLMAAGLSGGLVLTIPHILFFAILAIRFPVLPLKNSLPGPFGDMAQTSPIGYIVFLMIMTFIFGFVYALIGMAISTLFKQTLFSYIFPFILYLLPAFVFTFLNIAFLEPTTTWDVTSNSEATIWTIGGQLILLGGGSIGLFYYKVNKMRFPHE